MPWPALPSLVPLLALSQTSITVVGVLAVGILILLSAFFASSEIAIFSLADHRIQALEEQKRPGAGTLARLKSDPRRLLVTILVGNNVANIGMSAIATGLLGLYFDPGASVLIATFGITSLVLLFGESAPKSYAVEHSEDWALRIARPLRASQIAMYPLIRVFDTLTRLVNRVMGSKGDFEKAYVSRAEIQSILEESQQSGVLTDEENRMLQRLIRFRNRTAKETMVPRLDVVGIEADADLDTAIEACLESGFSQFPVYEDELDTVLGTVRVTELMEARLDTTDTTPRELAREAVIVPETKDVDELLTELQDERRRMAIVVDEFGTMAGIVTIEDIVEEIIGEVLGETEAPPIRWLADRTALVRGELNVHTANEALGTKLPETGEFETIAGLVLDRVGRMVEEGETVTYHGTRLVVETMDNQRVLEVRIELADDLAEASDSPEG